jgi:exonuclease SbcD
MRILHFADLHIGVENYGRIDPATGLSTRLLDFLGALDEVVEFALTQDVDLVLLAGDAYKSRDPSQTQQREFASRLARLSSAGIPVFLLVGNHDLPHAVGRATALEIFKTLQVPNLYVGDQLQTYQVKAAKGLIQVVALPWPRRSRLLTREDTQGMSLDAINQRVQELLTQGVKRAAAGLDPSLPAILTAHVTVSGAKVGSERSMDMSQDHILQPSALHLPAFDYVALGHIHKHQFLRENPLMAYAGSLQRVDFGEEGEQKGFCVVDLDPQRPQGTRLRDFRFQPVRARDFVTIDVKVSEGSQDPTQEVVHHILRHHVTDAIVRVEISLTAEQSAQLQDGAIRQALKDAHYVAAINRQVGKERRTRIPSDAVDSLDPMKALNLYLDSRRTEPQWREKLLRHARELVQQETQLRSESSGPATP